MQLMTESKSRIVLICLIAIGIFFALMLQTSCSNESKGVPTAAGEISELPDGIIEKIVEGTIVDIQWIHPWPAPAQVTIYFADNTKISFMFEDYFEFTTRYPILIEHTYLIEMHKHPKVLYWFFDTATEIDR